MSRDYSIFRNKAGRLVIRLPNNKIQNLARFILQYTYDINLEDDEQVHHCNGNINDDYVFNLMNVNPLEHIKIHYQIYK